MGDFLDDLRHQTDFKADARKARPEHPDTFLDTQTGEIGARFDEPTADAEVVDRFRLLLESWGFDPAEFRIEDDRIEFRTWTQPSGGQAFYYKGRVVRRRRPDDLSDLVSEIRKHRTTKQPPPDGDHTYVVALSDWQLGKADGDGTRGTVARVLAAIDAVAGDVKHARKRYNLGRLVVAGLGDLIENCDGQYAMQTFATELDRREQVNVARRLLVKAFQTWAPLFASVDVVCVPGNHGENRRAGKSYTTFGDNDDVAVFDQLRDVLAENERYGHVRFGIPDKDLSATLQVGDVVVGFAHGHQAKGSGPMAHVKVWQWWKNQAHGRTPIGDADVIVTGHFHHFVHLNQGARTFIQAPALDGGSEWFEASYGYSTEAGTLTVVVGPGRVERVRVL